MDFTWTIVALVVVMAIAWRFLGSYMVSVYEGRTRWLSMVERPVYRIIGVDPEHEQSWQRYSASVIAFSGVALLVTYGIFRLQGSLPFNPQHLPGVTPALSWNTSVSFVTNTNWQAYSGETTMSYLSQMGALAVQNFLSAAVGIAAVTTRLSPAARPRPRPESGNQRPSARRSPWSGAVRSVPRSAGAGPPPPAAGRGRAVEAARLPQRSRTAPRGRW
jgi:K+-transporting ATPase ATPase A chain